tara:strand:+ start:644 stop:1273 length:630 start_codon:yes stop_codon:yes gene_type:complete
MFSDSMLAAPACTARMHALSHVFIFFGVVRVQVLGGETLQTKEPNKTFALLRAHIQAVRESSPGLYCSPVLVVVERNLGFEAEHLFRACEDIPNTYYVRENNQPSRIGVLTTLPRKQEFVTLTNVLLRESRIFAWETSWTNVQNNGSRKVLHEQLSYFGYTFSAADNLFQKERFSISGKGAGGKDDLCMAFLIGLYVAKKLSMGESFMY